MKFNNAGPVFGSNGLLELDSQNTQKCPVGFNEVRLLRGRNSITEEVLLTFANTSLPQFVPTVTSLLLLEVPIQSIFELSVRRPCFYSCRNNCPGGKIFFNLEIFKPNFICLSKFPSCLRRICIVGCSWYRSIVTFTSITSTGTSR